jgi:plasmid stabilization system protein ParE
MKAKILPLAEDDLEQAFDYYNLLRQGLGRELVEEFRRGVDRILEQPAAWQPLDDTYRRYRLHRFPYGIIYRVNEVADEIMIVAIMHLSRRPGAWHSRR